MKITIECECGNRIVESVPAKKYMQLRDLLENRQFYYDGAEIIDGKLKEIAIACDKCKNRIILGID